MAFTANCDASIQHLATFMCVHVCLSVCVQVLYGGKYWREKKFALLPCLKLVNYILVAYSRQVILIDMTNYG